MTSSKKPQQVIQKKEKPDSSTGRLRLGAVGTPYLSTTGQEIQRLQKTELKWPRSLKTYDAMRYDAAVDSALTLVELFLTQAFYGAKVVPGNKRSKRSVDFANYVAWNLKNLQGNGWYDVISNISSYAQYGHAAIEKVYQRDTNPSRFSQYPVSLKALLPIPQHSIIRFDLLDPNKFITQAPPSLTQNMIDQSLMPVFSGTEISRQKVMMFSWDSRNMNPLGRSPLEACFKAHKEKTWIEDYQVVGIAHDMTGVMAIRVPQDQLSKAVADPDGDEADSIRNFQRNAANVQNGDQTYLILSSDTNDNGKYEYDVDLLSTSGGKQFDLTEVIDQRIKAILNCFGAGVTIMGQNGGGSYALSETGATLHAHYQTKHQLFVRSVFETDLFPQLAALNGLDLTEDEMPKLMPAELDSASLDEMSKMLQRVKSVNGLIMEKEIILDYHEKLGFDVDHLRDMTTEQLQELLMATDKGISRAGESMGTSGTGSSQDGGKNSTLNSENVSKSIHVVEDFGDLVNLSNGVVIDKEELTEWVK